MWQHITLEIRFRVLHGLLNNGLLQLGINNIHLDSPAFENLQHTCSHNDQLSIKNWIYCRTAQRISVDKNTKHYQTKKAFNGGGRQLLPEVGLVLWNCMPSPSNIWRQRTYYFLAPLRWKPMPSSAIDWSRIIQNFWACWQLWFSLLQL